MSKRLTITIPSWLAEELQTTASKTDDTVTEVFRRRYGVPAVNTPSSGERVPLIGKPTPRTSPRLEVVGDRKIQAIKLVREYGFQPEGEDGIRNRLSLKEALDFIERAPVYLREIPYVSDMDALVRELRNAGCTVLT